MGRAKEIVVKVIPSSVANPFVKKHHYSGKVVANSSVHFGAFLGGGIARRDVIRVINGQTQGHHVGQWHGLE